VVFELLIAYLAFIRTAHYWTETHPHLEYEIDVQALLGGHAELAALLLDTSEAELIEGGLKLRETLHILERARVELRESERQFRSFVTAASDVLYKMSADWQEMHLLHGKGFLIDTSSPRSPWLDTYIPDSDKPLGADDHCRSHPYKGHVPARTSRHPSGRHDWMDLLEGATVL
jgi:hypothetical protein